MHYRGILPLVLGLLASVAQAATVRVASLESLVIRVEYHAPARVVAEDHSLLSAQIGAQVLSIPVRVGDAVRQGQLLVRLDCRDYELALQQAESSLQSLLARIRLARQQLNRAETLAKQRNVSEELLDQRRSELDRFVADETSARLQIDSARLAVKRCLVKAPFDGVVSERLATEGSLASAGTPLLRLLRDTGLEVEAELPLDRTETLVQAGSVLFENGGHRYPLKLRTILPLVDSRTRTRRVRLEFTDEPALAGASGRLVWQPREPRVPASLLVRRDSQLGLMLFDTGRARFAPLPRALEGQAAAVDLPPGTLVIIEGQHAVTDGDAVERQEGAVMDAKE
ncbi:efflux RND transporter periplasmic adaptor subunit [Marinobacterium aestuariivivens]|uniref:Efflux RND transporter periplasmic adaptor subunit n=1 Tax=Marinobacterium aestuariivivens TaxID=1698799 RepID=A0ABW1ZZ34_9GAMM